MIYSVTDKTTGLEVSRYAALSVHVGDYPLADFYHTALPEEPNDSRRFGGRRTVSKLEFISLLGDAAYVAVLTMARQSVEIEAWIKMIELTSVDPVTGWSIDLDDPRTAAGVQAIGNILVSNGVVAVGWAEEVLNG